MESFQVKLWRPPSMDISQPLWATCSSALPKKWVLRSNLNFLFCILWSLLLIILMYTTMDKLFFILQFVRWRKTLNPTSSFFQNEQTQFISQVLWPPTIFIAFHRLIPVCQCLTPTDKPKILYNTSVLVSMCQRKINNHSFWPSGYAFEVSLHWCKGALLIYAHLSTFLPVYPKPVLLCVVTLPLVQQHICFFLGSVRFVLAHFSRPSPEWHFYVTHELAKDAVYPTVQAATDELK